LRFLLEPVRGLGLKRIALLYLVVAASLSVRRAPVVLALVPFGVQFGVAVALLLLLSLKTTAKN
jgi:hypothetical protein